MAKTGRSPANDGVPTSPAEDPERLRWLRQRPGAPSWQGIPAARARVVVWVLHCELVPATMIACPPYCYIVARLARAMSVSFSFDVDILLSVVPFGPAYKSGAIGANIGQVNTKAVSTPQNPSHRESLGVLRPTIQTSAEPPPSLPEIPHPFVLVLILREHNL
ncbi:hypothetical protein MMYC01_203689 [Madurella mycetomatis]|uniref:Uncharacterized protein n=1 Tax=Madurella mycetomatis TaxID=100816 RepID=A0A175W6J8_9PEZI|nr:hypothetical protein MMYC01_203689 [Madurella mycetomatis]